MSVVSRADIRLPYIFADRMILQQKSLCPIWGWANPLEEITVKGSWGMAASVTADEKGNWQLLLQTPGAGGPYYIDFIGKNYHRVSDVLIGEVILASGMSNMELPMSGWPPYDTITGGPAAIASSANDNIRFFQVQQSSMFEPQDDAKAWWTKASPEVTHNFSAMAYFYARNLNKELGVPVGVIQACWNGSDAECWASLEAVKTIPTMRDKVAEFERCKPLQANLERWITGHNRIILNNMDYPNRFVGADFYDKDVCKLSFNDSEWKTMKVPTYMDNPDGLGAFDGVVWFRKWVNIPSDWVGKKLILSLGPVDDMDVTFVNGEKVGESIVDGLWNTVRKYEIMPGLVRAGDMLIAVRVIDNGNGGGICGVLENQCVYPEGQPEKAISIAGDWKYLPTAEYKDGVFYYYDYKKREYYNRPDVSVSLNMKTITALWNSMIYPIIRYKTSAVIWSQGESNVGRAGEFMKFFPAMINSWRSASMNPNLKFYCTQVTPYPFDGGHSERLREAQRRIQYELPGVGMVCLLDKGKYYGFQSSDKEEAADRLLAWAFHDLYGKDVEYSGPEISSFVIMKDKVELTFSHTTGGIVSNDGKDLRHFEVVDSKGNAYEAKAEIKGDKIIVWSDECKSPKNVRYAYHDWVEKPNFFNGKGFPASSFTTEKKVLDNSY